MFFSVYCSSCFLNDKNGAFYSTCSLVGLLVLKLCFWPARTIKKVELLVIHASLGPCAEMLLRHNWRKLDTFLFFFTALVNIVVWLLGPSLFASVGRVLCWSFLVLHFYWNVCNWVPKLIWTRRDWFWSFSFGMCSVSPSSYPHGLKPAIIVQLCFIRWHQVFSMNILRYILICSSMVPVTFSHEIIQNPLVSFINAIQLYFSVCASSSFIGSSDESTFLILLKTSCSVTMFFQL